MSQNLKKFHEDFLEDLEIGQGRSPRTVANYDHYLRRFFTQQQIKTVRDINLDKVRLFRRWLSERRARPVARGHNDIQSGLSSATQNYHLIALRQFLKYLAKRDVPALAPEKVELAKVAEREIDVLYPEEIDLLLAALKNETIDHMRDGAIVHTLFSTGMRVSEAVRLDRDDVRADHNEIAVRGKGNKVRVVFLSKSAQAAIRSYLDQRKDADPALFIRHKAGSGPADNLRLTARSIQRLIKKYAVAAGITKNITPHTLRHSFATDLLSNGADVRQVQHLLGHASITTTQVYTHLTDVKLREVHEKFHHTGK